VARCPSSTELIVSGDNEARTFVQTGGNLVHYGTSARTDRFEWTFLDALNGRDRTGT
jgi:hypothetical protein